MLALDRVYDNARARARLGWRPVHDFADIVAGLKREARPAVARSPRPRKASTREANPNGRRPGGDGLSVGVRRWSVLGPSCAAGRMRSYAPPGWRFVNDRDLLDIAVFVDKHPNDREAIVSL